MSPGVERARHLYSTERSVVEQTTVFPGKRHALGGALVDDLVADFGEPIDVGFARAIIAAFDRVVEQPEDAVAVVVVVLGGVDPSLGGDAVGPPRAVVVGEDLHVVAQLPEGGSG